MRQRILISGVVCASLLLLPALATAVTVAADEGLARYVIAAGGGESSGGGFRVTGTIGQHDAGALSGGDLVLHGGFWQAGGVPLPASRTLYLPVMLKQR
jgi:hypothetical protein